METQRDDWNEAWDESLARTFGPPGDAELGRIVGGALDARPEPRSWARAVALAAAIFVIGLGALVLSSRPAVANERVEAWVASYREVEAGAVDVCVCTPGCCEFVDERMVVIDGRIALTLSGGVTVHGSCCDADPDEASVVAECEACAICLFVVDGEDGATIGDVGDLGDGVRIHRRELGGVTVFELSRLDEPVLLPGLAMD